MHRARLSCLAVTSSALSTYIYVMLYVVVYLRTSCGFGILQLLKLTSAFIINIF